MTTKTKTKRKILIIGHAKHGKTTVAEALTKLGYTYKDSSEVAAEAILPFFTERYGFQTAAEMLAYKEEYTGTALGDTIRRDMYEQIRSVNLLGNFVRIPDMVYSQADIYVGLRDAAEFMALMSKYSPLVLQVDACQRLTSQESIFSNPLIHLVEQHYIADWFPKNWVLVDNNSPEFTLPDYLTSLL